MVNFKNSFSNLQKRRMDSHSGEVVLSNSIRESSESDALKYLRASMEVVPEKYTKISYREGDRVLEALRVGLESSKISVEFKYQGSVTNNTHIRTQSDIDLLVLRTEFYSCKSPLEPSNPYIGNATDDLVELRLKSIEILEKQFWAASIGKDKSKCIPIEGGSLLRKVDVVPSNWLNTVEYESFWNLAYRGVKILDMSVPTRITNFPFLHNLRLEEKDRDVKCQLKPLIRFLKNLVADEEELEISSYDLAGLAYSVPDFEYPSFVFTINEFELVKSFLNYSKKWENSSYLRSLVKVPNGTRGVFKESNSDGISLKKLKDLNKSISLLVNEIERTDLLKPLRPSHARPLNRV